MLARVSRGIREEELDRAHFVTTFFLLGFESGHRERRWARRGAMRPEYIRYLAENTERAWLVDSPFFAGWCMGWKFDE